MYPKTVHTEEEFSKASMLHSLLFASKHPWTENLNSSGNHVPSKCQILSSFPQQQKKTLVIPPEVFRVFFGLACLWQIEIFFEEVFSEGL